MRRIYDAGGEGTFHFEGMLERLDFGAALGATCVWRLRPFFFQLIAMAEGVGLADKSLIPLF